MNRNIAIQHEHYEIDKALSQLPLKASGWKFCSLTTESTCRACDVTGVSGLWSICSSKFEDGFWIDHRKLIGLDLRRIEKIETPVCDVISTSVLPKINRIVMGADCKVISRNEVDCFDRREWAVVSASVRRKLTLACSSAWRANAASTASWIDTNKLHSSILSKKLARWSCSRIPAVTPHTDER